MNRAFHSIVLMLTRNAYRKARYLKKRNIFRHIGDRVAIQGMIIPLYPKLIKIHDDVIISTNVTFITHDTIHKQLNRKYGHGITCEKLQAIEILDNCFIGSGVILNGNVRIGPNSVVAAGSVVTKDVPPNTVVAGVPARIIGSFDDLLEKRKGNKKLSFDEVWHDFYSKRDSWLSESPTVSDPVD